ALSNRSSITTTTFKMRDIRNFPIGQRAAATAFASIRTHLARPVTMRVARICAPFALLAGLTALVTGSAVAQTRAANDTVSYLYLKGADTVAVERVVRRANAVHGELLVKSQPRVVWVQHLGAANSGGTFDLDAYAATAGANAVPAQSMSLRTVGDSGFLDIHANGSTNTTQRLKLPAGVEWMLNASVLHTDVLTALAQKRGLNSLTVVLVQGGQLLPLQLRAAGDTTVVNIAGKDAFFIHDGAGLKEAIVGQDTRVLRVAYADQAKISAKTAAEKLSYAAPAGAPYTAEDVVINTASGFQLAGTLTRPRGIAHPPVVVTISGSGEQERDSRLSIVNGYAIFRDIADTLGRRGIAVLRVDDRGVGASTGHESRAVATSADYANDVREVVKYLRSRRDIDTARIALLGHSEGGMIAPMVASQDKGIRAIALLAGPAYTGRRVLMFQNQDQVDQVKSLSKVQRDSIMRTVPHLLDSIGVVNPWIGFFMQHDPVKTARLVSQPVLILQGATDHQITPEQADTLGAAFRNGGNKDVTVKKFPETNHLFLPDAIGEASGYAGLKDVRIRREVLGTLADWFAARLK
ncbi:MAG: alpha/beta fold hydrolase, partial [Gemmatimonadota bacterium]|nr:alpha/beta fold hydrolase [Gemmatimonadota bacterium]